MNVSGGRVIVVGDVMTDIIVRPEGPLVRGSDRRATIGMRPGGSGANQAVWLAHRGVPTTFVARVGAADFEAQAARLTALGVTPALAADPDAPSGVLVTLVDPDGERSFLTDRGANLRLSAADLPESLLEGAGLVVLSGYSFFSPGPRAAVIAFAAVARRRGVPVAVDPASVGFLREVGPRAFLDWTAGAAMLFANRDEAEALTGSAEIGMQMQTLGRRYKRVIIKRGAAGAVLGDRSGVRLDLPAPQVATVESTGAGDAFAAGFIAAELSGADERACLAAGIAAGAEAVARIGGQPGA